MNQDDDKWDSFETYKGPPEPEWPSWLDWACKVFFAMVGLGLVFLICGGLLWILPYRFGGSFGGIGRRFAMIEEPWMAWARFILGGVIGVAFVIRWWRRATKTRSTRRRIRRR
jgi:hypothetical protein